MFLAVVAVVVAAPAVVLAGVGEVGGKV
eukprot:SAG31_NODE_41758_length_274_cov_1.177143_1_plen_27_part_01